MGVTRERAQVGDIATYVKTMTVKTTIHREVEFGIRAKITYRASRNGIRREVEVKTASWRTEEWERVSSGEISAKGVPQDVRNELIRKSNEDQSETVTHHRELRQNLRGANS